MERHQARSSCPMCGAKIIATKSWTTRSGLEPIRISYDHQAVSGLIQGQTEHDAEWLCANGCEIRVVGNAEARK